MINKVHSKLKSLFLIAFVAAGIGMLASCSSSNQLASSFSHRKYTTGHFSDPLAKVKTDYKITHSSVILSPTVANNDLDNSTITQTKQGEAKPIFSASSNRHIESGIANEASKLNRKIGSIAKTPLANINSNISLQQTSIVQDSPAYSDHGGGGGGGGHHHYLRAFFLCILIGLILFILGIASLSGFILLLSYLSFLFAVIFFVLWIVSLAD